MKYGVHLGCWGSDYSPSNLRACLQQVKSIGAQTFEIRPTDGMVTHNRQELSDIRAAAKDSGIELLFTFRFPRGFEMVSEDPAVRENATEYLKHVLEGISMAGGRALGGIVYSIWPARYDNDCIGPEEKYERTQRSIECIRKVMPAAENCGVTLSLEIVNRFEHYILNTVQEGLAFCRQVESPNCRLLLDTFHMNIEEDDIPRAIRSAEGCIGHFHVCEPNRRIPHHSARIDWKDIGKALRDVRYDRTVTIETFLMSRGAPTHDMRIWRNLEKDISLENRLRLLCEGLEFVRAQFEEVI